MGEGKTHNQQGSADSAAALYAGDISPVSAWDILQAEADAVLVDVRTDAEWAFVGGPDLGALGKELLLLQWQVFPQMARDGAFSQKLDQMLRDCGAGKDTAVIFICRSGARSRDAAISLTGAGYHRCYNLAGGFEGDLDAQGHRGQVNGWKCAGLPWRQR
ncbi:MAG TPA: sulfurtransferase [Alphaproteobacteria bacterium]|nr:sulfurtransferase [Alphaproteobacteria bacterium]HBC54136.1 sulfurtransferase [Alphaproteobacteria bacterium]